MKRLALVVGIDRPQDSRIRPLRYAVDDARQVANLLEQAGHTVRYMHDCTADAVIQEIELLAGASSFGDQMLIYFSGHGVEANGRHLLLCADAMPDLFVTSGRGGVWVDELKVLAGRHGANRALVLDTCREALLNAKAAPTAMTGTRGLRDLVSGGDPAARIAERGGMTLVCSCDEGDVAQECGAVGHGLFSHAFVACCREAIDDGRGLHLDKCLVDEVERRMQDEACKHGLSATQRPWSVYTGAPAVLVPARRRPAVHPPPPASFGASASAAMRFWRNDPQRKPGTSMTLALGRGIELDLVWMPAGQFTMGSPESEEGHGNDETAHPVKLTRGFWMGRHPVTQEQYEVVADQNPSDFKGPQHPVEQVSWSDAAAFCQKLTERLATSTVLPEGMTIDLPTEAQWEYACRAGTRTRFWLGARDEDLIKIAWCYENSDSTTHPVGRKAANAWGLHDVHGNVWEWCHDWYGGCGAEAETDPEGPASGEYRVSKGGSWGSLAIGTRCAARQQVRPDACHSGTGFRIAVRTE